MEVTDVGPARSTELSEALATLCRAFADSPILEFLVPRPRTRARAMRAFFGANLTDGLRHGEVWIARSAGAVAGVAIWLPPGAYPPDAARQRRQLRSLLGVAVTAPTVLARSLRYLRAVEAAHPLERHWYLSTLGVDPGAQRTGVGTRLQRQLLAKADQDGLPTYLETDKERNLAYYLRSGFELRERLDPVAGGPPTWTMAREPRAVTP